MKPVNLTLGVLGATMLLAGCSSDSDTSFRLVPPASEPPAPVAVANANVLFSSNRLASMDTRVSDSLGTLASVNGLSAGDALVSIDRRPQNGFLYALGYNAVAGTLQLYTVHPETMTATAVGSTGTFVGADGTTPAAIGNNSTTTRFEMDFNPSVDRLRIVSSIGENIRINPNTGAFVDGDLGGGAGSVAGLNMDGSLKVGMAVTGVQGTAYTNSRINTATTTQYTVDGTTNALYLQNPPNAGTLGSALSLSPAAGTVLGFDIAPSVTSGAANTAVTSGSGFLAYRPAGGMNDLLATLDLTTGMITAARSLGSEGVTGFALQQPSDVPVIALTNTGTLLRFNSNTPGTVSSVAVSGLTTDEALVGIDYRPATGQLIGLGINATANTGTLYRIDPQLGTATVIGSASSIAFVDGSGNPVDLPTATGGYGVNFNPVVDRIRVTTGSGLNFRLNPNTGAAVDGDNGGAAGSVTGINTDGAISGATTSAAGASYTNSVAGTAITTLYTLDSVTRSLFIQTPPNAGTQTGAIAVTLGGSPLMFGAPLGFDMQANVRADANNAAVSNGSAYAALTVAGVTSLYLIDLVTGQASNLGTIGDGTAVVSGLSAGITHAE